MKKILLPTDFSKNSWNAIIYALQLFKDEYCTFFLLNTYTPVIYQVEFVEIHPAEYDLGDLVRENALKQLDDFKTRIKKEFNNPKHTIETMVAFNTLISEVNDVVTKQSIDYIVMGTTGATGIKEVLFGTNTVHVFKNTKCPVLAIPEDFAFEAPHEVLFPTDYKLDYKNKHIKPLINILSLHNSRVHVLHASYGYELSSNQENNKKNLETHLNKTTPLFTDVSGQTVTEAIDHFQLKAKVNLLVMINNKHSFFENLFFKNTINQIGFHLNIPFLVIPAKT
ncbi:universal stress protein [Algibacter mikhailovii]|uniref:universal stress protein n=1 Tax=Algibacter mikhailovii TaxID=425498 RepID=UPI002494D3AA|nr:universal stress protein [Algibacter mikhailovii]